VYLGDVSRQATAIATVAVAKRAYCRRFRAAVESAWILSAELDHRRVGHTIGNRVDRAVVPGVLTPDSSILVARS
jgi:hypothetical protein